MPTNDDRPPRERLHLLPERRSRQPRQFASAALDNPVAHIIWPDAQPDGHLPALRRLAAGVASVGHSSSLAQVWVDDNPPPANWRPADRPGGYRMRVPYGGRLDDLTTAYALGQRPQARRWAGYRQDGATDDTEHPHSVFNDDLIVFETTGSGRDLRAAGQLTAAFRNLIMSHCPEPIPEWVSGHTPDGGRSEQPHLALIPLPFVGRQHADGRIMGLGIALPRGVPDSAARRCLHPLFGYDDNGDLKSHIILQCQWNETTLRPPEPGAGPQARYNLRAETWTRPSDTWHTATPVTLDRYYKGPDKVRPGTGECGGAMRPHWAAAAPGSGAGAGIQCWKARRRPASSPGCAAAATAANRQHTHATIRFAAPVRGPVIIGSGPLPGLWPVPPGID